MLKRGHVAGLGFAILLLGSWLRLADLAHRPMHTDEAVHALKFAELLENGAYRYDRSEYHGPTLNVFTLIPAWGRGQHTLAELDEITLRLVPAFFGIGLIFIPLLLSPLWGRRASLAAAAWIALSPAQIFYSRYYIQEVPFIFFFYLLLTAWFRYRRSGNWVWMMVAGLALGLLHASKETDILVLGAAVVAGLSVCFLPGSGEIQIPELRSRRFHFHAVLFILTALLISSAFFTAGFSRTDGWIDSFRAYITYFHRGAGESIHLHPWHYYLGLLFFFHRPGYPVFSEAWILPFVLVAGFSTVRRPPNSRAPSLNLFLQRFLLLLTLILCIGFSALPYKTPWNMLCFEYGLLLLAGFGAAQVIRRSGRMALAGRAFLLMGLVMMGWQSLQMNRTYDSSPANPWVYAHPGPDVVRISRTVEEAACASPDSLATQVEVIVPGHEYWPLPWTLRRLTRVGYYDRVDDTAAAGDIILAAAALEAALLRKLYQAPPPGSRQLYVPLWQGDAELRPGLPIRGYIRQDLRDGLP